MDKAATLLKAAFANEGANEPDKLDSTAATTEAIAALALSGCDMSVN